MANPLFTIGHSVRTLGVFVDLLKAAEVRLVVDVRAIPRSRTNPQYNGDTLPSSLSEFRLRAYRGVGRSSRTTAERAVGHECVLAEPKFS
jgi:uncharacterized protein (DUF488 family)